jgi:hypothetical protein
MKYNSTRGKFGTLRNAVQLAPIEQFVLGLIGATLLGGNSATLMAQAQTSSNVTSPAAGVICDRQVPVCYNPQGASVALTQTYFGKDAANRLKNQLRNRSASSTLRLSNGAVCDLRTATCWNDGWRKTQVDNLLSQQLFGQSLIQDGSYGMGLQGLEAPRMGVVCDPGGKTCYDQAGVSLGLTREYFGNYAELAAQRYLEGQTPQQQFRVGNNNHCDTALRTCWSDNWNRKQVNAALTNQLFSSGISENSPWKDSQSSTTLIKQSECTITRWLQTLFRGECELQETTTNLGRLLVVRLQDGSRYYISRPTSGNYELTDPQGKIWPMQVRDQGQTVSFNWSDRVLSVRDLSARSSGPSLGELIDSLLGR